MGNFLILLNCHPVVFVYHDDKEDGGKFDDDGGDVIDVFLATEINDNGDVHVDSKAVDGGSPVEAVDAEVEDAPDDRRGEDDAEAEAAGDDQVQDDAEGDDDDNGIDHEIHNFQVEVKLASY